MRTREGMKVARAKGRLRGKQPKLTARQEHHLVQLHHAGEHTTPSWPNCSPSEGPPCTEQSSAPPLDPPAAQGRSRGQMPAGDTVLTGIPSSSEAQPRRRSSITIRMLAPPT
jgi:hypothetical protein